MRAPRCWRRRPPKREPRLVATRRGGLRSPLKGATVQNRALRAREESRREREPDQRPLLPPLPAQPELGPLIGRALASGAQSARLDRVPIPAVMRLQELAGNRAVIELLGPLPAGPEAAFAHATSGPG